ncbi:MAG: COR domain-containing protein [Methylococcales bacterium]
MIPDLLPPNQPQLDFDRKNPAIAFEFRFTHLLPRQVLPAFIVSRHHEIDRQQVWQTGVLLKNQTHSASALIIVNYSDRVISIQVQGKGASDYLHIVHDEILAILEKLQDIQYEERLYLPNSAITVKGVPTLMDLNEKGDYRQMLAMLREGHRTYISSSGTRYDLFKIMGGVMTEEKLKQEAGVRYSIRDSNVVISNGPMWNTAVGGNVQITQSANHLTDEVRELIRMVKIELQDSEGKNKAVRELESLREDIKAVTDSDPSKQEEAAAGLKQTVENIQKGIGYTATVTEGISNFADKLLGLADKITAL